MKRVVKTSSAPAAIGPYSQAVIGGGMVFCSGQIALDPATGEMAGRDVASQTRRVLQNLREVLKSAGASLEDVVKTTVFLRDMNDFGAMNEVYAEFFSERPPARAAVQAARLPKDALVEIEAIAVLS
ncbi:MAG: RidA family protein [Acidobacteriota bacterium]|jgi:2-iminobutanoate/2-iminopropanoate deaminase